MSGSIRPYHTGIYDYLTALGSVFSLTDIELLANYGQLTPSTVISMATGAEGEDRTWLYMVQLSQRAIDNKALLTICYARAKKRHTNDLRNFKIHGIKCSSEQHEFYNYQIEHYAHHLSLLELCVEFGIGLWSRPFLRNEELEIDDLDIDRPIEGEFTQWSNAVRPEIE